MSKTVLLGNEKEKKGKGPEKGGKSQEKAGQKGANSFL